MSTVVGKYLNEIREATSRPGIYVYRGQQKAEWPLHSAATRRLIKNFGNGVLDDPHFSDTYITYHREKLVDSARAHGFGIEYGRDISDLQLLTKLQHFGAATGLLDFTWSPLVALWFACHEADYEGELFILNANDAIQVAKVPSDPDRQTIDAVFSRAENAPGLLYWEPMWSGDAMPRILRQRGVFIIGRPLVPTDSQIMREIEIAKDDKPSLLEELAMLDISKSSLFPDIYGFSESEGMTSSIPQIRNTRFYLVQGNQHYQEGDYPQAIAAYDKCIERASDIGEIYFLRGNAKSESKLYREAIADYKQTITHKDRPFLGLGLDVNEAVRNQMLFMVYFNCGNALAELSDYEDALIYYSKAIQVGRSEPMPFGCGEAFLNRGNTYMDLGKFRDAIGDYDKAIASGKKQVIFNKGNALVVLGRFNEALDCYKQAEQEQMDRSSAVQNVSALERIMGAIGPWEYQYHFERNPDAGIRCVVVQVAGADSGSAVEAFQGRVGNTGSFGWKGPGGKGFGGKHGFIVRVAVE